MNHGAFCWYELATTATGPAGAFYHALLGWQSKPVPEMHYTVFLAGEHQVAGMMPLPESVQAAGVPPHWNGYIAVDDVDEYAGKAQAAGATLRHGPDDIQGIGRFAVLTDPQGAVITLFRGTGSEPPPAPQGAPGHVGWHELRTSAPEAALDFYATLFGWSAGVGMDMGSMGVYQIFDYGGSGRGGIMRSEPGAPSSWLYYFNVPRLDPAMAQVQQGGGMILHGPQEVPGNMWIAQLRDPQGAATAILSASR